MLGNLTWPYRIAAVLGCGNSKPAESTGSAGFFFHCGTLG
jgi:hypothetical protein